MSTTTITTTLGPGNSQGLPPNVYTLTTTISPLSASHSSSSSASTDTTATFGGGPAPTLVSQTSSSSSSSSTSTSSSATTGGISAGGTTTNGTPVGSSAATGAVSPSNTPNQVPSAPSNTGLIVGIAVLGVLLAIALGIILFLLLRRQRRKYPAESGASRSIRNKEVTEMKDRSRKGRGNITSTEIEASLLAGGGRAAAAVMDDKQAHAKFAKLNRDINDWVLTHFRNMNPRSQNTSQEVLQAVRNQPHYRSLLQDARGKYLVLRGIVADGLTDAFDSGEINGFGDVFGMKERFPTNVGAREKATWRSSTVLLLEKDVGFHERQTRAVDTIAQRIDYVASGVVGVDYSENRLKQLTTIVQSAAELALELAKQRMNFVLLHPSDDAFEPSIMEDVLQESRGEHLRGYQVLSVVFPAVVRYGDENGDGFDRRNVISKALVLAAAEGNAI